MIDDNEFLEGIYKKADTYSAGKKQPSGFVSPKINIIKRYAGIACAAIFVAVITPSLYFGFNKSYPMVTTAADKAILSESNASGSSTPAKDRSVAQEITDDMAGAQAETGGGLVQGSPSLFSDGSADQKAVAPISENRAVSGIFASAETAPTIMMEEIAAQADVIVIGEVKKIEKSVYESENDMDNLMSTSVQLKAAEVIKGSIDNRFTIKVSGGYDPKNSNFVPYEAVFQDSELTLLFLTADTSDSNVYTLAGNSAGKFAYVDTVDGIYSNKFGNTVTITELKELY